MERWGYGFVLGYLEDNLSDFVYDELIKKLVDLSTPPTPRSDSQTSTTTTTTTTTPTIPQILITNEPTDEELQV